MTMSGGFDLRWCKPKSSAKPLPRFSKFVRETTSAPSASAIFPVSSVQLSATTISRSYCPSCGAMDRSVAEIPPSSSCAGIKIATGVRVPDVANTIRRPQTAATTSIVSTATGTRSNAAQIESVAFKITGSTLISSLLDNCWNAGSDAVFGNIRQHHRVRTDQYVIPNRDWSQQFRAGSDVDVVPNDRGAGFSHPAQSNHHAIANAAVVSELGIATDYNSTKVVDDKISTNLGFARQFYARNDLNEFESNFVDKRKEFSED